MTTPVFQCGAGSLRQFVGLLPLLGTQAMALAQLSLLSILFCGSRNDITVHGSLFSLTDRIDVCTKNCRDESDEILEGSANEWNSTACM